MPEANSMAIIPSLIIFILIGIDIICASSKEHTFLLTVISPHQITDLCKRSLFVCIDPDFILSKPDIATNLTRTILDYSAIWTEINFFHNKAIYSVQMPLETQNFVSEFLLRTNNIAEPFDFERCTLSVENSTKIKSKMVYVGDISTRRLVELSEEYIIVIDVKNHLLLINNVTLINKTIRRICHPDNKCNSEVVVVNGKAGNCAGSLVGENCNKIFCDTMYTKSGDYPFCYYEGWVNNPYICKKC